jgi:hypothetical protein
MINTSLGGELRVSPSQQSAPTRCPPTSLKKMRLLFRAFFMKDFYAE